ncbi:Fe-S protein assembly co-chaperone HscB [Paracidobacterium acidisoli]|uniref:Fe-S protein assembly co-chaperone HscB n=1 Tax=Paracidobacterium acidisoli TaxID=2303751 RepID=A0A372IIX6_9BACT|nr:Fe-S protein assembly co-chaperone HscB [Paracidobacterium acidisoli]MBT9333319.1 Fe-S protein assembly co-chaperone HscB [Paracidobacterium acidisoli]
MQTAEHQSVSTACWSCGAPLAGARAFCDACGKVQPPSPDADYFTVFGLPRRLAIDTAALERVFYRLSRKLHPDVYARASANEQQWSLDQTSLLNDAWRTLKNPVSRTEYLLRVEGVQVESERAEDGKAKESRVPADLLEEVFELNMQLEEMRMNRKMGDDDPALRADLEKAKTQFEAQLAAVDADLQSLWSAWDAALDNHAPAAETKPVKDSMVALLDRRRYLRNLVRDVNDALGN